MTSTRKRTMVGLALFSVTLLAAAVPPGLAQQGPCSAMDQKVTVSQAFYTGADLSALSDHDLGMYAAGYVDALQAATMIGVTEACRVALQTCVLGRSRSELASIVRDYLRQNPHRVHGQSSALLYNAIFSRCLRGQP